MSYKRDLTLKIVHQQDMYNLVFFRYLYFHISKSSLDIRKSITKIYKEVNKKNSFLPKNEDKQKKLIKERLSLFQSPIYPTRVS